MKYQSLNFKSDEEFQSFFGQLASAEIDDFEAIEGSGGDLGFDGISSMTAYQVYFPDNKNRTDLNYKSKIDKDLAKVLTNKDKLGLEISHWVFVVPEDLRIGVVAHLKAKSRESGIKCIHWGATKLTELVSKHPHVQDSFPTIFLPPVRDGINEIKEGLKRERKPRVMTSVNIMSDTEFKEQREMIINEYKQKTQSFMRAHGTSSSAYLSADMAFKAEMDKKLKTLTLEKGKSDRAYNLELEDIKDDFNEQIEKTNNDMAKRGIFQSGIRLREIAKIRIREEREIQKLALKYGKEDIVVVNEDGSIKSVDDN